MPAGIGTVMASARFVIDPAARMASVAAVVRTIRRIASSTQEKFAPSVVLRNPIKAYRFTNNTQKSRRLDGRPVPRLFIAAQPISYQAWEND
jgi:hypothetical protein